MNYFVRRGAEQLGPFSLADLQQQVQVGKISPGDLAQSEGMQDWAPVSQVIGNIPVPATAYGAAAMPATEPVTTVDLPPNLHWSLVVLANIISQFIPFGVLFNIGWTFLLANWARKLSGDNNVLILVAMYPAGVIAGIIAGTVNAGTGNAMGPLLILGGLIAYLIGIFRIKGAMVDYYNSTEKMNLSMSGVMTFFFSTVYLQYKVNEIAKWKKSGSPSISFT